MMSDAHPIPEAQLKPRKKPSAGPSPKFEMRMSPDVRAVLTMNATAANLSEAAFVRSLILGANVTTSVDADIERERNAQLARIGNNLNQIARHADNYRNNADAAALAAEVLTARLALERLCDPLPPETEAG
ncbi:plasmid mobilization protein [Falsirhodobacter halotolerans]|uniref:plasmid mobilization protein n=1 Tax=Falsirhodobacter halotolerans TaxID=1146892 RepID=UPI001FD077E3|nr:plasmid mobilization relaxosome protein MobC [Falsirhodobacter halotolerans]MCJ8140127.1 plasmid mobilization relaxosome protein MobC [Falsirhodobacter halotolerans]